MGAHLAYTVCVYGVWTGWAGFGRDGCQSFNCTVCVHGVWAGIWAGVIRHALCFVFMVHSSNCDKY